jgi:hypothetical protein
VLQHREKLSRGHSKGAVFAVAGLCARAFVKPWPLHGRSLSSDGVRLCPGRLVFKAQNRPGLTYSLDIGADYGLS